MLLTTQLNAWQGDNQAKAIDKLKELMFQDGELIISSGPNTSLINVHLLLDALLTAKGQDFAEPFINEAVEKVFQLIPGGNGEFMSDATLITQLNQLSSKKLRYSAGNLLDSSEYLLQLKHADDAATLAKAYDALDFIRAQKSSPIYVYISNAVFQANKPSTHQLVVNIVDLFGQSLPIEETEILSLKVIGKDSAFMQNSKVAGGLIDLSGEKLGAGRYLLSLSCTLAEKSTAVKHQAIILITDNFDVREVSIGITDSKQIASSELQSLASQNMYSGGKVSALGQDVLHVNFQISSSEGNTRKPHQVFLRFANEETAESILFPCFRTSDSSSLEYSALVAFGDEIENFSNQSGEYLISLLVGDVTLNEPIEWIIGTIELNFPAKQNTILPLYAKSLLHTSDTTLKALPEIEHQMRPPARRASSFMAALFTVATLAPLVIFIAFMFSLKPDVSRMTSLSSFAFLACLVVLLVLYVSYWLALEGVSFYATIKYLCFLLPTTAIIGKYALSSVAAVRQQQTKSNKKL